MPRSYIHCHPAVLVCLNYAFPHQPETVLFVYLTVIAATALEAFRDNIGAKPFRN
jgi:hypothetical protein